MEPGKLAYEKNIGSKEAAALTNIEIHDRYFPKGEIVKNKLFLLLCFFSLPLYSQTKTFVREYTYTAGEADSKITSRSIALDQVKRILLEEIGVYLQSTFETTKEEKNNVLTELTKEQIQSITAGVTETKILEEKWNGVTYYIKASITVNTDDFSNNIARISNDKSNLKELEEATRRAYEANIEIDRLRKQLAAEKDENQRLKTQKEYATAANSLSASDWFQKGYNAYEAKDIDNAIVFFKKAIDLDPKYAKAYNGLGNAYYGKANYDKAMSLWEKAIELDPKYAAAYNNLGNAYKDKGNYDKAIPLYEKSIELDSNFAAAYNNLGLAYVDKGNYDKAMSLYEKAIELDPKDAVAYYNLGNAYYDKGNHDKAMSLYEKAIELDPKCVVAYDNLGLAYYDKGNYDKAIPLYEKAIELDSKDAWVYYNLGNAYGKKRNTEKKIECYMKAAQLGNTDAQSWLKQNGYTW
ncbi:MAG: tetratricopeptide repeat protein [Bacteroidota bacterium]